MNLLKMRQTQGIRVIMNQVIERIVTPFSIKIILGRLGYFYSHNLANLPNCIVSIFYFDKLMRFYNNNRI
jgi:hypothetical protein